MEQVQLLDGPDFSRALGFSHRRKCDPEKEGTAASGCKRANQSRSVHYGGLSEDQAVIMFSIEYG